MAQVGLGIMEKPMLPDSAIVNFVEGLTHIEVKGVVEE